MREETGERCLQICLCAGVKESSGKKRVLLLYSQII